MHYVILRDDDTNALTPAGYLERLYRPFLERGWPVNLATIPEVTTKATTATGIPEGFLLGNINGGSRISLTANPNLIQYLKQNPGYRIVQHGLHHEFEEFERDDRAEVIRRLDRGTAILQQAGLPKPRTFVAPHDRLSRVSLFEVARRFEILSAGWYEFRRLPRAWWPAYVWRKIRKSHHWHAGHTLLLAHPGCILSRYRSPDTIVPTLLAQVRSRKVMVLVTHWWEYFPNGVPDEQFIAVLHRTAKMLSEEPDVEVIAFEDLLTRRLRLN